MKNWITAAAVIVAATATAAGPAPSIMVVPLIRALIAKWLPRQQGQPARG